MERTVGESGGESSQETKGRWMQFNHNHLDMICMMYVHVPGCVG